jgi:hypothetical protein
MIRADCGDIHERLDISNETAADIRIADLSIGLEKDIASAGALSGRRLPATGLRRCLSQSSQHP